MVALLQWRRERLAGAEVTLVTPFEKQAYSGMVPGHLAGHFRAEELMLPVAALARAAQVKLELTTATALDAGRRSVRLADGRTLGYDVLSLDSGGVQDRDSLPGAREHALWVRPMEPFLNWVAQMFEIARERLLDVVVIGGGAAGVELALAVQHRLDQWPHPEGRSRVTLVAGSGGILRGYPAAVVGAGMAALGRARVVVVNEVCTGVSADHVHLGNGARLACDAPIVCSGSGPSRWLRGSGLGLDDEGFVATGPTLQTLSHPEVFAAGDLASRPDAPHPRSGVHAVRAGKPLAANIRALVAGGTLVPHAPPPRTLNLLACGGRRAIASWGPWQASGAWAWWWKRSIDLAYVRSCREAAGLPPTPAAADVSP